jgi:hypothetical protein
MRAAYLATFACVALAACTALGPAPVSSPPPAPSPPEPAGVDAAVAVSTDAAVPIGELTSTPDAGAAVVLAADATTTPTSACNEQSPQDFLVRKNFLREPGGNQRAIDYRNLTYGAYAAHVPSGAKPSHASPNASAVGTTFMGLPVRMHKKVVPALKCVEEEIRRSCVEHPYTARALAGIRFKNTYRGGEVTNHIYGIAIDVDPARNTCCGCVSPWNNAPRCQRPAKTEYDRMEMPECWVHAFERYGFYWLGHDVLQDTMHFEFLGDPDRIERVATPAAGAADGGK